MKLNVFLRQSLAALLFAATVLRASAAVPAAYEGEKWSPVDSAAALRTAKEITPAKYPDSDEATVEKKMVRLYRADGTGECQDETYVKVLTEKGKRHNRTLTLYFMLPYSRAEATLLEVIKPNGQTARVDIAANSKEMIDDSQMAANIYDPNVKVLRVNIPNLEPGDLLHSITRTTVQRAIVPGEFADDNLFEGPGYIRHLTYEVYAPAEKPLKRIVLRDEVPGTVLYSVRAVEDNLSLHRWEVRNVPRMFDEPSMPPYEITLQRLLVSTTPDWRDISKWYWLLSKPHLDATTPEMQKAIETLTASSKTDEEKIKALFYHVAQKIRYMGLTPEKDRPGFEPHDVKLTFNNKYGVCRDKAALLVSMLSSAGFNAYPVLMNVGMKRDMDVPEPAFNHAIVGVELKKGEYLLMDPTAENTKDLLPSYECDQSYLVCRPEGETLRVSPILPPDANMMRVETTGSLSATGALEARANLSFDGINDNEYREAFSRMKPDELRRFFERILKRTVPGAKLKTLQVSPENVLDLATPLRANIEFSAEGLTASGNGKAVVSLPWLGKGIGLANFILGGTGLEKRKYPLRTDIACGVRETLALKLDSGFAGAVSMPTYGTIADPTLGYQRAVELKEGSLLAHSELKLKAVEFSPAEYLKLKESLKTMEYDERKTPVLATSALLAAQSAKREAAPPQTVDSNARILESRKELRILDAHTQTLTGRYVKKVLTYSGKKTEAEVKFGFNPSCEEAKILHAVVTSKDGHRQELSTNEINIMDAGWNASAKRYTGGKILVANLPGVDLGSTIEVDYQFTAKAKPFLSGFESFQTFDDLDQKTFQLTAPEGLVQTAITGAPHVIRQEQTAQKGESVFTWNAAGVKALPAEHQLPPEWTYMSGVEYFAGDFKGYLRDLNSAMLARSREGTNSAALAHKLTAELSSKRDALKAIRDYVAKNVRVAGPTFTELPLAELSNADTTLADGYGHLADRAILLHAMLQASGFAPEFVLSSDLPAADGITNFVYTFPLPSRFQMPLVRVELEGEPIYLNDTDQYSQLGTTGEDNHLALALASQDYFVVQAARNCQDQGDVSFTLSLSDSGTTRIGITHRYFGRSYNWKNRYFSELPPEERKRYYQELVSGVAQGARPVGELETKFDVYPGLEQFTVEVDNYSVVDGRYAYLDLPFTPSLYPAGADSRTLPLLIPSKHQSTIRTEIDLPPNFQRVDISPKSEALKIAHGLALAQVGSSVTKGKQIFTHQFTVQPGIVSAAEYPDLLTAEASLGSKSSKVLLLEAGEAAPNATSTR